MPAVPPSYTTLGQGQTHTTRPDQYPRDANAEHAIHPFEHGVRVTLQRPDLLCIAPAPLGTSRPGTGKEPGREPTISVRLFNFPKIHVLDVMFRSNEKVASTDMDIVEILSEFMFRVDCGFGDR